MGTFLNFFDGLSPVGHGLTVNFDNLVSRLNVGFCRGAIGLHRRDDGGDGAALGQ